ncbi:MAG: glycosyltransferase [bacterium]
MRMAFLVNQFPALSQTFILNQIVGLLDRGHEVHILANRLGNQAESHPVVYEYDLLSRTYSANMPTSRLERLVRGGSLATRHMPRNPRAVLRALDMGRYGAQALSLQLLYLLVPFLDKGSYDVVHCHFGPIGVLGVMLREVRQMKEPVVTSFHGYDVNVEAQRRSYTCLFQEGALFTVNSNFTARQLIAAGAPRDRIVKLPVGLSVGAVPFVEKRLEPGAEIRLLTVARLVEKKGLEYSIRAVAQMVAKNRDWNLRYAIVGTGPLYRRLKSLISQLSLGDRVELLGPRNQASVMEFYQRSHIFVLASVVARDGDREGQGLVLQEAQAAGLPVVATLHNGIPEGVLDGESAFLVPERDVDALAERIEYLIQNAALWPEMGRAGRRFVEAHYDIDQLNDQLEQLYYQLLRRKSSSDA